MFCDYSYLILNKKMKIKTQIFLGVSILLLSIFVLSLISTSQIYRLEKDIKNILEANYNTLKYATNMHHALENNDINDFKKNLKKQQQNITEEGEKELTELLEYSFNALKNIKNKEKIMQDIRIILNDITKTNMNAIEKKSDFAQKEAKKASFWVIFTSFFCGIVAFFLLIFIPRLFIKPLQIITESITHIANRNYKQRIKNTNNNEFLPLVDAFNTMAYKLEIYENSNIAKLLSEQKRLETLINKIKNPIIGLDENKKILYINQEILDLLVLKKEETIGKYAQSIENTLLQKLIQDLMIPLLENEKIQEKQNLNININQKDLFFEKEIIDIIITPTGEKNAQHIGNFIILNNITIFKELDKAKTNFIATVSHELKTPIASIKMSLQLLENQNVGNLNKEQNNLVESIKDDTQRLLKITSELLNLTQVETGNIQLFMQETSPYAIVDYAVKSIENQMQSKHIALRIITEPDLPKVKADADKTAWVIINFLTNAIRYAPENSNIEIKLEKNKENKIIFSVSDEGKGIADEYKDKVFERYFQVPNFQSKTGTGLGLAICKGFIEAQNGKIGVESIENQGSTFYFIL